MQMSSTSLVIWAQTGVHCLLSHSILLESCHWSLLLGRLPPQVSAPEQMGKGHLRRRSARQHTHLIQERTKTKIRSRKRGIGECMLGSTLNWLSLWSSSRNIGFQCSTAERIKACLGNYPSGLYHTPQVMPAWGITQALAGFLRLLRKMVTVLTHQWYKETPHAWAQKHDQILKKHLTETFLTKYK